MHAMDPAPGNLKATAEDDALVICRCEGITLSELQRSLQEFDVQSVRQLKLVSRVGMGICQGRTCRPIVEAVAMALGLRDGPMELSTRPPVRPVTMDTLIGGGES